MRHIVIAGDRTIDRFSYSQAAADIGENWRLVQSTQEFCVRGGVLLLDQLTRAAIKMRNLSAEISVTPPPVVGLHLVSPRELHGYVYKPGEKSDERRTNRSIVPWDKLPESVRKYDRVDPEEFAGLIFEAGYEIV